MQANSENVLHLQGSLTLSYTESSKRLHKDQHKIGGGKHTCKLQYGTSISEELLHSQGHLT